jgi:aromatic-L-amino-acid decarboxylase
MDAPMSPLDPLELKHIGADALQWLADYWSRLEQQDATLPVLSQVPPGDIAARMPIAAPERAEEWDTILRDLDHVVMPGITHWQSPNFFAFFPANISTASVVGELLSAGLGVQGMLWATSPAATEVETRVMEWLGDAVGLPRAFTRGTKDGFTGGGVIQGTASEAALVAMVAARDRVRRDRKARGLTARPEYVVYTSQQAHSSIVKAAMIAGIADDADDRVHVRLVPVDHAFRMRADVLERWLREDMSAGRAPCFIAATLGTTGCTAIDDVPAIASAATRAGFFGPGDTSNSSRTGWLHVDAAHAGAMAICPEFRGMLAGIEECDSICFNPHKWLLTNFDCDCFWTRDARAVTSALSVTPEYLRNAQSDAGAVIDYRDWQVPLGRRFRALKLWFVLRRYGLEALREYVREHIALAAWLEEQIGTDSHFELCAPRTMNLVCFRLRGTDSMTEPQRDALNKQFMDKINASGAMYFTHTVLPTFDAAGEASGTRLVLRMAIGASLTKREHVEKAWEVLSAGAVSI